MRLEGRVVVITGAAGGMGKVAAELFASEGARVVVADVLDEQGEATTAGIRDGGGDAVYAHADVSKAADAEAMIAKAVDTYGSLDVLYNNAGIMHDDDTSPVDTPEEIWDRTISINLKGVFLGCRYGIPAMLASGGGSIVNVASFVALMGAANPQIAYTASKGGVLSMTREIAVQYARQGIRANAICPGPIETPLTAQILDTPEKRNRRLVHIPIGRFGRAEEVVRAALFLASDESSLMTGASLVVDGGITAAYLTPE
ncbi:MAG TPA: glucose 1-dehydrogenase [Actinomycetota bacterium]|nr:glucose 1-dehydrogenase [Actinomycetota bacterium]